MAQVPPAPLAAADRPPSVDDLARSIADVGLPHPLLVDAARVAIAAGHPDRARAEAEALQQLLLQPVVNATGVLLHTNLGRAPLEPAPPAPATRAANLELDLATGRRGSRQAAVALLLRRLTGADAALVVNNGAAAVLLALTALARGRAVVVSRGELVEIGGGFRVPDVLAQSGARLLEVGTTNRTRLDDYRRAVARSSDDPALLLKVHPSNYRVVGFTSAVPVAELRGLGIPVVADLGSGLLDARCPWVPGGPPAWLQGEEGARQALADGAALVTFSGDKLLGGPQAGVIAGRADLVAACGRHPLARALRPGGLVLGELQRTLLALLRRDADAVPFWRMAGVPVERLRERAAALELGEVVDTAAVAGGGSLPGLEIPSAGVALPGDLLAALRSYRPPVVGRVQEGRTLLDLRTVDPADDAVVAAAGRRALAAPGAG
ncbi:MAG: L-seryl-tRNA(Sec) selenium transferase [Acidimicrobiales bacterium]|nr:L-seryl-tRNA(Sec) selenium transferase [Acidimicrobiales bacterium]